MDLEPGMRIIKQGFKTNEEPSRGFKPVVPIPMTHPSVQNSLPKELIPSLQAKLQTVYESYIKLFKENKLIRTTIQHVNKEKTELAQKLNSFQANDREDNEQKKKRHRRVASEIVREYRCPMYDSCDKSYGAQASLTQHIKLKHSEFYDTPEYTRYMQNLTLKKDREED